MYRSWKLGVEQAKLYNQGWLSKIQFPWLGIHDGAARKRRVWDHADLMHNILNSSAGGSCSGAGCLALISHSSIKKNDLSKPPS